MDVDPCDDCSPDSKQDHHQPPEMDNVIQFTASTRLERSSNPISDDNNFMTPTSFTEIMPQSENSGPSSRTRSKTKEIQQSTSTEPTKSCNRKTKRMPALRDKNMGINELMDFIFE